MSLNCFNFAQILGTRLQFSCAQKIFFIVLLPAHVYMHPKVILNILYMVPSNLECVEPDMLLIIRHLFENSMTFENRKSDSDG